MEYDTHDVLRQFKNQLFTGNAMFEKQPVSTGVPSLYLINGLIGYLGEATLYSAGDF